MSVEVRKATPSDVEVLRPLMVEWISECNPEGLKFDPDPDILVETFARMCAHEQSGVLVMMIEGQPIGILGLIQHNWGACRTANFVTENMWYVSKKYAAYAKRLVEAAKVWARERGADYLIFSTNRLACERSNDEFLAAVGFRPLYGLHLMEVNNV